MWTRAITQADMMTSCGTLKLEGYRVDVYSLTMQLQCSKPATDLPNIKAVCGLNGALDEYIIRLVEPAFSEIICMVESEHEDAPTAQEIADQCPGVGNAYVVKSAGSRAKEASAFACRIDALPVGDGLYDQPVDASALSTDDDLTWLAGQLIWNGTVKAGCDSAVNPKTLTATPCGNAAARGVVLAWQNQFDAEIFKAAQAYNVPARLLKRMMIVESQMWPYYEGDAGETGIMQVTDNGLDTLLRFDQDIDPEYLSRDEINQLWARALTRETFTCRACKMEDALQHIKDTMPYYARLLAAFHCRAVTVNPALVGPDAWRQSVVDYNGSGDYLLKVEQ
jgi:hypothetical protein